MLDDLRLLADAVDRISVEHAKQVVDAVNRRLSIALRSTMIRVYWRSESESGVNFRPVTHTSDDSLEEPRQFELTKSPRGLLAWVFENKKTLWIEGIQDHIDNKKPLENKADSSDLISTEYLWFGYPNDCAFIFPLIINGQVRGLYSFEGEKTERIRFSSEEAFKYAGQVVQNIASILDRAYDTESELAKRGRGVKRFLDKIRNYNIPTEVFVPRMKSCFIARPYQKSECKKASEIITHALENDCFVKTNIYVHEEENYIIDGIMKQIKDAHFCVADITGLNPNVMMEVGMMITLEKKFIIIKEKGDNSKFPFDINQRTVYRYEIDNDSDTIEIPQTGQKSSIDLISFLKERIEMFEKEDDSILMAQKYIIKDES